MACLFYQLRVEQRYLIYILYIEWFSITACSLELLTDSLLIVDHFIMGLWVKSLLFFKQYFVHCQFCNHLAGVCATSKAFRSAQSDQSLC